MQLISDEDCDRAAEALRVHEGNQAAAARDLDIPRSTLQEWIKKAHRRGKLGFQPVMPGYIVSTVSTQTGADGVKEREWITQRPEPVDAVAVPDGHSVKGVSSLIDETGAVRAQWVKTKADEPSLETITDSVKAALEEHIPAAKSAKPPKAVNEDLATVYALADFHVGLLSWHEETGHDYDLPIATETIRDTMIRLVDATPSSRQAVILGLGDLLHTDGYEAVTPASGNRLDADGRYPKILRVATSLCLVSIDLALAKHGSVLVRILPGNHDIQSAIAVSLALSMYYRNEPRVTVDDSPEYYWWWQWGSVLLGATHGDKAKKPDLPLLMAARNPKAWGNTTHRHILTGHIHTETGIEKSGVTVESFRSPVATDAWHHQMGYGAGRSISAITYSREGGEIMRNKVNIV